MNLLKLFVAAVLAAAQTAQAATVTIGVGKGGLVFSPSSTTASVGDILEFQFFSPNHSVIQGNFDSPCTPATTGGFFSGFFATTGSSENANVFRVTVNDTNPIFVYCGFPTHCASGMVGVINPSSAQTLSAFMSGAANVQSAVVPSAVFGGQVASASSSSGGGSSTTSSAPPSASTSDSSNNNGGGGIYGGGGGSSPSGAAAFVAPLAAVGFAVGVAVLLV